MKSAPLILASASPRRLELLRQIGIEPDFVRPAALDETPLARELPADHVRRLARAKLAKAEAEAAAAGESAFVLAADTVVALGRRILPKAESREEAARCLASLSGRRHRVLGAIALAAPDGRRAFRLATTVVRFKRLLRPEIEAYLASGEWEGKAGGYAIQGRAAAYIPWISGSYSNVVGLALAEVSQLLHGFGFRR